MPINVPVIQQQTQQAAIPNAGIGTQVSPNAAGAAIGQGVADVGKAFASIGADARRRADDMRLKELELSITERSNEDIHGENGYLNKKQKNAIEFFPEYKEGFDKFTS